MSAAWRFNVATDRWELVGDDGWVMGSVEGALLRNATPERRARLLQLTGLPAAVLDLDGRAELGTTADGGKVYIRPVADA